MNHRARERRERAPRFVSRLLGRTIYRMAILACSGVALVALFFLALAWIDGRFRFHQGRYSWGESLKVDVGIVRTDLVLRGQSNFKSDVYWKLKPDRVTDSLRIPGLIVFETYDIVYSDPATIMPLKFPPEPDLPTGGWRVRVPLLALVIVFAILPLRALLLSFVPWWRRRRRQGGGRCTACGYDLTGNVSGVCPECGEKVDVQAGSKGQDGRKGGEVERKDD